MSAVTLVIRSAIWKQLLLICFFTIAFGQHLQSRELRADPNAVFPVEDIKIETPAGLFAFTVEIADDDQERSRGLMERETMLATHGMLFDFGDPRPVQMWMANTPMSLDMVFVRPDGIVARVEERTTPFSRKIIPSGSPVSHVLELRAGLARQIGLGKGSRLIHERFGLEEKP